jgi:hypothetical protein
LPAIGTFATLLAWRVAGLDRRRYPIGKKVSAAELKELNLEPDRFPRRNYVIRPRPERR